MVLGLLWVDQVLSTHLTRQRSFWRALQFRMLLTWIKWFPGHCTHHMGLHWPLGSATPALAQHVPRVQPACPCFCAFCSLLDNFNSLHGSWYLAKSHTVSAVPVQSSGKKLPSCLMQAENILISPS